MPAAAAVFLLLALNLLCSTSALLPYFRYTACAPRRYSCGGVEFNLSYPFTVDVGAGWPNYCGSPGYNLVCADNSTLVIYIQNRPFKVVGVEFLNRFVTLVDMALARQVNASAAACSLADYNTTVDYGLFGLPDRNRWLQLYVNCSGGDAPSGATGVYTPSLCEQGGASYYRLSNGSTANWAAAPECEATVMFPLNMTAADMLLMSKKWSLEETVSAGFLLQWTAGVGWCSDCVSSGGYCGHLSTRPTLEPTCYCPHGRTNTSCFAAAAGGDGGGGEEDGGESQDSKTWIFIVVGAAGGGGIVGAIAVFLWICRRRKMRKKKAASSTTDLLRQTPSPEPRSPSELVISPSLFSYEELFEAAGGFAASRELGGGGFGTVYKGSLRDGRTVAIKRLYEHNARRAQQFANEAALLTRLRHPNLVALYGCTPRNADELLLVYEFIPNGTLADHLHGARAKERALTWRRRVSVAVETAGALAYLHAGDPPVIHRDVKTDNILLDGDFHVKVADFGLSRSFVPVDGATHVSTAPVGTPGYVDPDYHRLFHLTDRSDVYSFGVVLLELITSKPAIDVSRNTGEISLAAMAVCKIQQCELKELVDPALGFSSDETVKTTVAAVAEVAFRCLQDDSEMRPLMKEVLGALRAVDGVIAGDQARPPPASPDSVITKWTSSSSQPWKMNGDSMRLELQHRSLWCFSILRTVSSSTRCAVQQC